MANSSFLVKPWFWIFFIVTVIVSLYFYGLHILGDRTVLAQTKKELEIANQNLQRYLIENRTQLKQISEQRSELEQLSNTVTQNKKHIIQLGDSITKLINRPPEIRYQDKIVYKDRPVVEYQDRIVYKDRPVVEYQDRIVYKDKSETYHPYGKGYGKITLFKSCNCYNLKFWIDGNYAGQTNEIFNSIKPYCGQNGTVSKIILSGKHRVQGKDQENHYWDFYITLSEDQCLVMGVK